MKAKRPFFAAAGRKLAVLVGAGAAVLLPFLAAAQQQDWGDAPAPYPTTSSDNGARHSITGPRLGTLVDGESNGQPHASALGDDLNPVGAGDDEDGVVFLTALVPGQTARVLVTASATAKLDAFVDFAGDGRWTEASDRVFAATPVSAGANVLSFTVPTGAKLTNTVARFRISVSGDLSSVGAASNGEVEDYLVPISAPLDFGDAPTNYPTLFSQNGARHIVSDNFFLGQKIDSEPDGQPDAAATGDDLNPAGAADDEDGVKFIGSLIPGQTATVEVTGGMSAADRGLLDAWMDFNSDGDWADEGEQIFNSTNVVAGLNTFSFSVPASAVGGTTYARFRLSHNGKLNFRGEAQDGEVEDYRVNIAQALDYSDAPGKYPTKLADNGARHVADAAFCLGAFIDVEPDGQPDGSALGDDLNPPGVPDDEDGVTFISAIEPGKVATLQVVLKAPGATTPGRGVLDAWMDFNRNESWADAGEQIFTSQLISAGTTNLTFNVPASATPGTTFARFRLSKQGGLSIGGPSPDGEVEDYLVTITAITQLFDFGDAPPPYPTLLKDNGARHSVSRQFQLGSFVDEEPDGQPNATATGDDINPSAFDDEDGVNGSGPVVLGRPYTVQVTASQPGYLNAWVDFNANGSWADSGDQIFTALALAAGVNNLTFNVPAGDTSVRTCARFRFSHQSMLSFDGVSPDGQIPDGEVEDYLVSLIPDRDRCDLGCEGREFWLTFPGNYAPDPDNPAKLSLCIHGAPGVVGTVRVVSLGFTINFVIPASRTAVVPLPRAAELGDANDVVTNKGIHVVTSGDVGITAFNHARYTTDSYQALHTSVIGTEYIVLGYGNANTNAPPLNGTQFALVAGESNTVITITPSVTTGIRAAGVPYHLTLQPGDAYQLRNTNDAPADLTGTLIKSDKPIAVFGSHLCANIPSSNVWFCDYLVEQLLPVNTWGNEFYTAPLATRTGGDTFRVLASQDNTSVSLNGVAIGTIHRGKYLQVLLTAGAQIAADKPVFVAQYANSADFDPPAGSFSQGDPFMLTVQATRHWTTNYWICTPTNDFPANYLNIVAPTSYLASIQLDGGVIPGGFTTIPTTMVGYKRVLVAPGSHRVSGPGPFGLSVYGWAEYDSYGHPGCFFLGDVTPPRVTPETPSITVSVASYPNSPGSAPVPNIAGVAQADDNCAPELARPTQTPPAGTLMNPGIHTLTLSLLDDSGNIGEANVTFTVLDPSPVTIVCPSNRTVNCTSGQGAVVNFTVTAKTTYDPNVPVVSTPPSGSLFPPGTTVVTNVATSLAGQSNSCSFTVKVICDARITAAVGKTGLNLTWPGTATLEYSSNLLTWQPIPTGTNAYTSPLTGARGFFRVRY